MKMITAPILVLLAIVGMLPPSCMADQYRNSLQTRESLKASEALVSGEHSFVMEPNCNLVLYHDSTAVWSTGTDGKDYNCSAEILRGGNLVVYSPKGIALWESSKGATGSDYVLVLQRDGNAVIYGPVRWIIAWPLGITVTDQWLVSPEPTNILYSGESLKTDESLILGSFKCTMQDDCNFLCRNGTRLAWDTKTAGKGSGCHLELDSEGKLAIYDRANSLVWGSWPSTTEPIPMSDGSYVLLMQKTPILAIYGPKFWSTNTATTQFSNRKIVTVMSQ